MIVNASRAAKHHKSMAVDPAKLCASWEVASGADKKRATSKQSFAQYCAHSEEQAEFFKEDFETIRKDVPRTHGKSFDNVELRELVEGAETSTAGDESMVRVLTAYVARNHQPGYAQGINFVAKVLLAATRDE